MYRIWFEHDVPLEYLSMFEDVAVGICPGDKENSDPYHQLEHAHGVLAGGRAYDSAAMDRAPQLLVISRMGIGYDKVDVAAATKRGIAVVNAPDAPTIPTAETAIALIMNVARSVKQIENDMQRALDRGEKLGAWDIYVGVELAGKQLGLVGLGRIGGRVARSGVALGMRVVAYDPYIGVERYQQLDVARADSLEALLGSSDVVSLHLPLNAQTEKIMNAQRYAQMKQGAIFVNVSRGGHVDEDALAAALDSGHLFGAGLDVTNIEPPSADNPLLKRDNVVVLPHIGGASVLGRRRLFEHAMQQILQVLRGERPPNLINAEVWETVRARREATLP